ncbi:hypothetical protein [Helicobacter rodentium]|uniref:hypothetical protein n=1 Tax=Helicobacter rodentium TaxID=59617 RepID=UPI0023EFFE0B|nr:hypothetical protein [Helicobacter rodentium]
MHYYRLPRKAKAFLAMTYSHCVIANASEAIHNCANQRIYNGSPLGFLFSRQYNT